jgi:hypothetical protein
LIGLVEIARGMKRCFGQEWFSFFQHHLLDGSVIACLTLKKINTARKARSIKLNIIGAGRFLLVNQGFYCLPKHIKNFKKDETRLRNRKVNCRRRVEGIGIVLLKVEL